MSIRSRSEQSFVLHNIPARDPAHPIWISAIPLTWQAGYSAAWDDIAIETRAFLEKDSTTASDLWRFLRTLAYGESAQPQATADPIEVGWIPTRNGNYRRKEGEATLVIYKNLAADQNGAERYVWGYGLNQVYAERSYSTWQEAHEAVYTALRSEGEKTIAPRKEQP